MTTPTNANTAAFVFRTANGVMCDVRDRMAKLNDLTIPELKIVAGDPDCQMTVRRKAEVVMRKLAAQASGFKALNDQAKKASRGHFFGNTLPKLQAERARRWE